MRGAAGVMGVVDDARDAGVDAAECRRQIADVHVLRAVVRRKALVRGRHVIGDQTVWNDPPELCGPRMAVAIDEPRNEDRACRVDDLRTSWRSEVAAHLDDALAPDVHIAPREV